MTASQENVFQSEGQNNDDGKENPSNTDQTLIVDNDANIVAHTEGERASQEQIIFGPLSKEESERLQREANEETTNSEDLRLFLEEMRQHMQQQQQQQQQQQHQVGSTSQIFGSSGVSHHQLQHQLSMRGHTVQQASNNIAAVNAQKKPVAAPEQDNVIDSSPDGGWGWIVVFSSFVCMILVDGVCLSYGLLVAPVCPGNSIQAVEITPPPISRSRLLTTTSLGIVWSSKARTVPVYPGSCVGISEMGEALATQSRVALMAPGGLLVGIYLLLGPLASALSNQFDFRPVAMVGGVVATLGLMLAAFSTNVAMLSGTLGGIGGIGFGLIYLPAIATVGHWFKRRRPFAVGLALCGSGVGSIIGGQIFPLLVQWFSWNGTLIVLAAFCMQCLVLIVLFRPLDLHLRIKYYQNLRRQAAREKSRRDALVLAEQRRRRRHVVKTEASETATRNKAQVVAVARAQATQARAVKKALKAQKAQQRRVIYRGSIMQRIIEEKRRQRTVSIGSLDGMVITRDNELIAAPLVADRPPLLTAASITRISEAVVRKMEARLAAWQDGTVGGGGVGGAGGETPVRCDSNVSQPSLSRKSSTLVNSSHVSGLSRLNLVRESLPQLVQDYVQSQASIAVQNYIAKQHHQLLAQSGINAVSGGVSAAATVSAANAGTPSGGVDTATALSSNTRIRSVSNATNIYPMAGSNTPQTQKARALSSLLQNRELTVATVEAPSPVSSRRFFVPSSACASECLSLRRTISDASITSSNRGIQIPLEFQQEVIELLDGEVRAEVQHRLRREMMRPQYKKDLFFTGSAQQLNHTPVPAIPIGDAANVWVARDQSNWDIGPTSAATQNPPATPNATISNRGFCAETDSTTTGVVIGNATTNASTAADAKSPIASTNTTVHNQSQLQQKISQTETKCTGDTMRVVMDYDDGAEDVISLNLPLKKGCGCTSPILTFLEELLAPGLLLSPTFIFLLLSNIFTMWGLITPYFMLPDMVAANNWTPHEAGSLISYIGLANTLGRCIATLYIEKAWSSHYKWADCLRVNVASLFLASVACTAMALVGRSYNLLVGAGFLFGLFSAVVVSLKSILVVELFGLDRLTNAFGHMLVLQGVGSIVGALLAGCLFDTFAADRVEFDPRAQPIVSLVFGSETTFCFAAAGFLLAAIFACPLRCLARKEVISATYTTTGPGVVNAGACGGGIYVDDYFDYGEGGGGGGVGLEDGFNAVGGPSSLSPPPPFTEPGTGSTSDTGVNLVQSPAPPQMQQSQPPALSLQQPFDSGIVSYVGDAVAPGGVATTTMETVEPPLPPPPPPQPTIHDPSTILSPAPLPSSLFLTANETEMQAQLQTAIDLGGHDVDPTVSGAAGEGVAGGGVAEAMAEDERGEVITTAGVPLGNPPSRSAIQPQPAPTVPESGVTWNPPGSTPLVAAVTPTTPTEVKTTLVAEEPSLEPVKEEEEEEEMEEQPRSSLSSSQRRPQHPPSSEASEPTSPMNIDEGKVSTQ